MKRLMVAICVALIGCGAMGLAANPAFAARLCVGSGHGCFSTIQAAVDAAHNGDTIHIGPGTFTGGITIAVSVKLIGAGAESTIIKGGGPVMTIGEFGALTEPTVSIKGVTITGGVTHSSAECGPGCGTSYVQATALGGGIEIPPAAASTAGATVTISNSVVAGNRVAPNVTVPSVRCNLPSGPCPFALAGGGGIDNWGATTLNNTTVRDNRVGGPLVSDADGGGILSEAGSLTLNNSAVTGNQAIASAPTGRFSEAGGIFVGNDGALTINDSVVSNNSASLSNSYPSNIDMHANDGGIHVGDVASARIRNTIVTGNTVIATNDVGDAIAFTGGIGVGGSLVLRDTIVANNRVRASTPLGSAGGAFADTGGFGIGDAATVTIRSLRLIGNSVGATSPTGTAVASSGAVGTGTTKLTTMSDSLVSGNSITATTATGSAIVQGGGIWNIGLLELRDTAVSDNTGTASGPDGVAQGGGIWNSAFPDGAPSQLTLVASAVTHNTLKASPGIAVQGGGLFTSFPVTLKDSVIAQNSPDQCYGC
jgi:hypothetical protein